jgi:hypothetical protein
MVVVKTGAAAVFLRFTLGALDTFTEGMLPTLTVGVFVTFTAGVLTTFTLGLFTTLTFSARLLLLLDAWPPAVAGSPVAARSKAPINTKKLFFMFSSPHHSGCLIVSFDQSPDTKSTGEKFLRVRDIKVESLNLSLYWRGYPSVVVRIGLALEPSEHPYARAGQIT